MKILDIFKENMGLVKENSKMRISKKQIEYALSDIQQKYINLLEWKSNQFDLYLKYQEQCEELIKDKKDLKKQLAETNEICNSVTDNNEILKKQIDKLERKIKRMESQDRIASDSKCL